MLDSYQDDYNLLLKAIKKAADIAKKYWRKDIQIWHKNNQSPVSEADIEVDKFLKQYLLSERPNYGWISEESIDERETKIYERYFVLDPIDGTRGFLKGEEHWCISLAIIENSRPIIGVLYCPILNECYSAISEKGAYLNDKLLAPLCEKQHNSTNSICIEQNLFNKIDTQLQSKLVLMPAKASLAYCFALTAQNKLDILIPRRGCYDWDIAAIDIILEECGRYIVDQTGAQIFYGRNDFHHKYVVCSPIKYQDYFINLLTTHS